MQRQDLADRWRSGRAAAARERPDLHRRCRSGDRAGRPWSLDFVPVLLAGRRVAGAGSRIDPAGPAARTPSSPISTARSGCCATATCRRRWCSAIPHFLQALPRHPAARRPLPACLRRRPRPRARRPLVGAGRPHPGAIGHRLRAGEPHRALALPARVVPRLPRRPPRRLLPRRCTTALVARTGRENPRIVLLTPGPQSEELLRARLPRPLSRLHAWPRAAT